MVKRDERRAGGAADSALYLEPREYEKRRWGLIHFLSSSDGRVVNSVLSALTWVWLFFSDRWELWWGSRKESGQVAIFGSKVSVVIPTYNREELLFSRALPSVLAQSYENIEVLVVSHGSDDGTDERVAALSREDNRVRLVRIDRSSLGYPNKAEYHWLAGPVRPINAGLKRACGRWIARIDDDDEWYSDHLAKLVKLADEEQLDFVSSSYEVIDGKNNRVVSPVGSPAIGGVQTWVYRAKLRGIRSNINCWRKKWNRVNDIDLQTRFVRLKLRFGSLRDVTVRIRPRDGESHTGSAAYLEKSSEIEAKYGISGL